MSWGLLFGTFITLLGTPLVYNIFSDLRMLIMKREKSAVEFMPPQLAPDPELRRSVHDEIRNCLDEETDALLNKKIEEKLGDRVKALVKYELEKTKRKK